MIDLSVETIEKLAFEATRYDQPTKQNQSGVCTPKNLPRSFDHLFFPKADTGQRRSPPNAGHRSHTR